MLTREQYFPGQAPEEQVALFIRRHWMAFLPWLIVTPLWVLVFLVGAFFIWSNPSLLGFADPNEIRFFVIFFTSACYLAMTFALLRAWMSYYLDVTIVTERRLVDIEQDGIFSRRISEQSLLRVQDVSARKQGFFQHFFDFGILYIETAGEQPNFELHNIPRPNEIARTILNLHDRIITGGGKETEIEAAEGWIGQPETEKTIKITHHRHPLEELRPYFPEPIERQRQHEHHRADEVARPNHKPDHGNGEGELHEGETIDL